MSKTRLKRFILFVLLVTTIISLWSIPSVEANPAYENFTTYTETDPNSHITVTNSTHISADLYSNETAYVYTEKGTNHFSGDFEHRVDVYLDNVTWASMGTVWALTDKVDEKKGLEDADENFLATNIGNPGFTFGYTTVGGTESSWVGGDDLVGCIFTTPNEAVVPKYIHAYVKANTGTINVKMAIYKNSDLSFICETDEQVIDTNYAWEIGIVQSQVTLESNTEYLLCVWGSSEFFTKDNSGAVGQTARDNEAYNGFPDPFVKDDTFNDKTSIYCTFVIPRLEIEEYYGGSSYTDHYNVTFDTWYYLLIERATSNFTCKVYTSATERNAEGTPDDTLTLTLQSIVKYDIVFAVMTYNDDSLNICEVEVKNYDFQYPYEYVFYGLYDEESGDWLTTGVNVTTHFLEGTPPKTFEVNGTLTYGFYDKPVYFRFDLTNAREYWVSGTENTASIYIFNASTTIYTIEFIDLTNQLDEYSYVSAKRQVNGTLHTIEKRKANKDDKVVMSLIQYAQYSIYIRDGVSYDYGQVVFTTDTTVQLTLTGLEFPSTIVEGYKYVRCWAYRDYSSPNTTKVNYQDLQEYTTNVTITYYFINDTQAYATWSASDTFISTWTGADENTTYYVVVNMERSTGTMTYRQVLPRSFSSNPWGIDFLWNSAPFNTNILIPAFIIVCVAGVFSALNARIGALATVAMTITLVAVWGLSISEEAIMLAIILVIAMGLFYGMRRVITG